MIPIEKREIELVVISDVHLGTYGARANELIQYLKSIQPKILVLNGDIIDIWQFSKRYFPESHMQVIKCITSLLSKGTKVYYITGNHDEMLRKFKGFSLGNFQIVNKLVLPLSKGQAWIFHGDVFDTTMKHSKWVAKLGGKGYDFLILINTFMNWISQKLGKGKISLSKKVKDSVKGVVKYVNNFEETAAEIAIENGYQFVVCGHIHQPQMREISNKKGSTTYLNSGDWVENSTALEFNKGEWRIYKHQQDTSIYITKDEELQLALSSDVLIKEVVEVQISLEN
jgi:UDP-2,3-diacylglucosamine pyrophosphatase LpxH